MRRWRRPPDICIRPYSRDISKSNKSGYSIVGQIADSIISSNLISSKSATRNSNNYKSNIIKRPISKGFWLKATLPNHHNRNRALLILFCCMRC